jgi:organic radical activating enzyme
MKARIRTFIDSILFTPKPLPEGSFSGTYKLPDGQNCRLHLRVNPNGEGLLIINASTILHLNSSAAEFAYHLVKESPQDLIVGEITRRYRISAEQVKNDLETFIGRIDSLILTPDLDPENFLDIDRIDLHHGTLSAPLRLDCALTYQVPEEVSIVYAPIDRVKRLLDTVEWKSIIQKAWDKGIPHLVFTGGEPTLRPDLPDMIAFAEQLGQVTSLITDGLRFTEKNYLDSLLQAGLDHVMIVLDPDEDQSWESLKDLSIEDIAFTVHLTIDQRTLTNIDLIIKKIKDVGTSKISLSTNSQDASHILEMVTQKVHEAGLSLVWDLPVPYSDINPVSMDLQNSEKMFKGAARSWLYVEPDGDVLPGQGINTVLGNLLTDSFDSIWSAAKIWLNER